MDNYSYLSNADPAVIDSIYAQYAQDPASVDFGWRKFFEGFELAGRTIGHSANGAAKGTASGSTAPNAESLQREMNIQRLVESYRTHAHLVSKTNPIRPRKDRHAHLALADHNLADADLALPTLAAQPFGLPQGATLGQLIERLELIYTRSFGFEYMHIRDAEMREWCRKTFEEEAPAYDDLPIEERKHILQKLNEAVVFESFLDKKFVGQKRFSLQGGENTIPGLDAIINAAAGAGVEEIIIGMAHRGRLNVLANILGKTYEYIFQGFEGNSRPDTTLGDGDVKYHLGYSQQVEIAGRKVFLKLVPNPSHLEAVDPVVQGLARAKADLLYNHDTARVLPVLLHGDAAVVGQGVVYEVSQMSALEGYTTGGTIHFVTNNQIGFTTDYDDARTSDYCTAAANATGAPIIHVNGDDAEAVAWAGRVAARFRQQFKRDFWIDMLCYRLHGHNESDEPMFTQPVLYALIDKHPDPREVYSDSLIRRGVIEAQLSNDMAQQFRDMLQDRLTMVKQTELPIKLQPTEKAWESLRRSTPEDFLQSPTTATTPEAVAAVMQALTTIPEEVHPIVKARKVLDERTKLFADGRLNWGLGEMLAYGTLLLEGHPVRLSGQDVIRGTFSHRHAEIFDKQTEQGYNSLNHMEGRKADFQIFNSFLSEYAVLGFEYGYSLPSPNGLTLWEAQFGDFANGCQVIMDQFICSGESKWQRPTGLVLLLPHGYEGQGPEHSNARPERYLQLCAEYNMVVANVTTPANYFHLLRRQLAWPFRKPLVVMSPKSLLRLPACQSPVEDLYTGGFQEVIEDTFGSAPEAITRVLLCSGKIYYDLLAGIEKAGRKDIAIVRLEQLYPLPDAKLRDLYAKYAHAELCWVQEEPKNMGAYTFLQRMDENKTLRLISRKASASPATGYGAIHTEEQKAIVEEAVGVVNAPTPSDNTPGQADA